VKALSFGPGAELACRFHHYVRFVRLFHEYVERAGEELKQRLERAEGPAPSGEPWRVRCFGQAGSVKIVSDYNSSDVAERASGWTFQ
jgi:hypothetical protein